MVAAAGATAATARVAAGRGEEEEAVVVAAVVAVAPAGERASKTLLVAFQTSPSHASCAPFTVAL